jgi:hypothetical protein
MHLVIQVGVGVYFQSVLKIAFFQVTVQVGYSSCGHDIAGGKRALARRF